MEPTNPSQSTNTTSSVNGTESAVPVVAATVSPDVAPPQPQTASSTVSAPEVSSPQVTTPIVSGNPVVNGVQPSPVTGGTSAGGGKKKWFIPALVGGAAVLLLAGGYVFAMYLPNRPESLFSTSLQRSGQAVDKLVDYMENTETSASETYDGTMTLQSSGVSLDATMKGEGDEKSGKLTLEANVSGQKFTADMVAVDAEQSDMPDMYVKVSGVKSMLEGLGGPQYGALDSQWIGIDHTLLDMYLNQQEEQLGTNSSLSATPTEEQLKDALTRMQKVNKEYLFSGDKAKAVVTYKKFEGKETKNGRDVNHYTAGYNKDNLKAYVEAVAKALDESKLNDWAKQQDGGKKVSEMLNVSELKSSIDKMKADDTFDMYVDVKTKLVQSVMFTSSDDKSTFTVAQNYTGGDVYPLELTIDSGDSADKGKAMIGMSVNTKTNELTVKFDVDMTGTTAKMDLKVTPSDKKVSITAPTGAKPVADVMKQLGLDQSVLGAQTLLPNIAGSAL